MNFFARQDQARKRTRWLIVLFALAVLAIVVAIDLIAVIVVASASSEAGWVMPNWQSLSSHGEVLVWSSLLVVSVILGASLYKVAVLGRGGGVVAKAMGGTQLSGEVSDPRYRQLRNVVEEIAIASGVPVPEIYVLEQEAAINAFAAGHSTGDAAIAVSQGCLEKLTRAELQGVVAHEFSHILNGDMRLNIRLMGLLFGILVIGLAGRQILRVSYFGRSRNKEGVPLVLIGLGLTLVGFVGLLFGRIVQAAVSRQREFLADASAVQFTREPDGIGGALKKIAATHHGSMLAATDGEEVGHMLFADGLGRKLFATHPPALARIQAIQPGFNPRELADIAAALALAPPQVESKPAKPIEPSPLAIPGTGAMGLPGVVTQELVAAVGVLSWSHVAYAEQLMADLPVGLIERAHARDTAVDVVLALLIDPQPEIQARQLDIVRQSMGEQHRDAVVDCLPLTGGLPPLQRLPVVELALPVVKQRPQEALRIYLKVFEQLIRADSEITVFEFALSKLVSVYLIEALGSSRRPGERGSLRALRAEIAVLFAVLAKRGHTHAEAAKHAYAAGMQKLFPMDVVPYIAPDDWVVALDRALTRLDGLKPMFKEALLDGLVTTLSHDGRVSLDEVELLRAISAALHCPLPPHFGAPG